MESTNLLVGSGRVVETLGREVEGGAGSEQSDAKLEAAVEKKKPWDCDDVPCARPYSVREVETGPFGGRCRAHVCMCWALRLGRLLGWTQSLLHTSPPHRFQWVKTGWVYLPVTGYG